MPSAKHAPLSVVKQHMLTRVPPMEVMTEKAFIPQDSSSRQCGNGCQDCESTADAHSHHHRCHNGRLRRFLAPFLVALVLIGGILAFSCVSGHGISEMGWESLVSRAVGDGTTNNSNTFVHRKLYLIIVFVGLLLVVVFAIMLSAWCCRGAFENPLCCPCYLCACCGGLACLECIGCGLCAEGIDQM